MAQVPTGHEERQAQQTAQEDMLSRYNQLGDMFDLPRVDLKQQLEDDLAAAREGRLPEFMRLRNSSG